MPARRATALVPPLASPPVRRVYPLLLVVLVAGCGGTKKQAEPQGPCRAVEAPAPKANGGQEPPSAALDPRKRYSLVVQTNCGSFTVALDQKLAPRAAASLVSLAQAGFFDGTVFHRIVPGFVIQGGDPTGTGAGGPGYQAVDRPPADARYTKGVVAMAKTQAEPPGASGSQFFVVTAEDAGLPPEYAIVGEVTRGLDVVERIGQLGDASERPTQTVEIQRVRVQRA